jgi:hypothetical protein
MVIFQELLEHLRGPREWRILDRDFASGLLSKTVSSIFYGLPIKPGRRWAVAKGSST